MTYGFKFFNSIKSKVGYELKRYKLYLFRSVWFFQIEPARYLYIWKVLLPHPKFIAPISFCGVLREMSRLCNMFSPKTVAINLINSKHYFWLQMLVQNLCWLSSKSCMTSNWTSTFGTDCIWFGLQWTPLFWLFSFLLDDLFLLDMFSWGSSHEDRTIDKPINHMIFFGCCHFVLVGWGAGSRRLTYRSVPKVYKGWICGRVGVARYKFRLCT